MQITNIYFTIVIYGSPNLTAMSCQSHIVLIIFISTIFDLFVLIKKLIHGRGGGVFVSFDTVRFEII